MVSTRSSKAKTAARSPRLGRGPGVLDGERRFAAPGRPEEDRAGAVLQAPAQEGVQLLVVGLEQAALLAVVVLPRDEPREDVQAALLDDEVVVAAAVLLAPELRDAQPPPLGAVLGRELLKAHDPVGDALELQVFRLGRQVVEQEHRAFPADEVLLEGQDLPPVAERVLGEQPHLRERVDDDPPGLDALDLGEDGLGGDAQLDLGRLEHGVLVVRLKLRFRRDQLQNVDAGERPAVRPRHGGRARSSSRRG